MKRREKTLVSLLGMGVVSVALAAGSENLYEMLRCKGPEVAGEFQPGTYEAAAAGFAGDVKVVVTVSDQGGISDIQIVDCSTETPEIGQAAAPQVAAAAMEAQSADVDGVAGATLTSTAVKAAIADCLVQAGGEAPAVETEAETAESETAAGGETEELVTETAQTELEPVEAAAEAELPENTYTAAAAGFGGDVKVAVTIGENGNIAAIRVLDFSTETDTVGQAAAPQVTAAIVKAQGTEVDGVSGATMTSDAIKAAVADCLNQAAADGVYTFPETEAGAEAETEAAETEAAEVVEGRYEASAAGFGGDVKVGVTIRENGSIGSVQILDYSSETDTVGQAAAPQITAAIVKTQSVDVDAVSGATMTSSAIITAVTDCLNQAAADGAFTFPEPETEVETEATETETEAAETEAAEIEAGAETAEAVPAAGRYEASAAGFGGDVKVAVTIGEGGKILSVQILDYSTETDTVGQAAAPQVTAAIVKAQSAEVDAVSGATMTSDAIKAAVTDCLTQAES